MKKFLLICSVLVTFSAVNVMAIHLADWATSPVQQVGDKIFTYVSSTLPTNTTVGFAVVFGSNAILSLSFDGGSMIANGQVLNYTIAIDPTISPSDYFDKASMDTSIAVGPTTASTKLVEPNLTLTSVNGNPSALVFIPGNLTFLTVQNTYTGGGILTTEADSFVEGTVVPEPSTITLLLAGLSGLLFVARRKTR
jgi:hypothetical protein